jgi:hypothetical protein
MRVVKNENLIKRNGRIGQWTSLGALAVLGLGMYLSFQRPDLFVYSIGALILGFTMTQVGMHFSSRFGRSPRPDERLDAGLKGLPGDATLYHYSAPVPHLLVGPMGLWVLLPYQQRGAVTYERNRWRLRGGGFMQAYMTIFGQEGLGRPDAEADGQMQAMRRHLVKCIDESSLPSINAILVFTNDRAQIEVASEGTPLAAVHLKKLKDFIRQRSKDNAVSADVLLRVKSCLPQD